MRLLHLRAGMVANILIKAAQDVIAAVDQRHVAPKPAKIPANSIAM